MKKLLIALLILSLLMLCVVPCYSQGGRDYQARVLTVSKWIDLSGRWFNRVVISFVNGDTTPSVYNSNIFKEANTAPTTITTFDNPRTGQPIAILFTTANTIVDFTGTNLIGNGGTDWTSAANSVLTGYYDGTNWYCVVSTPSALSGDVAVDTLVYTPSSTQVIDAVGDAILANASLVILNPDGDYTLTSTPTIADGTDGQRLFITCADAEANIVTVQDEDVLGSSNLELNSSTVAITGKTVLSLIFYDGSWKEHIGGGSTTGYVWTNSHNPKGDGSNNAIVAIGEVDPTNRRLFNQTEGISNTQDMDWYGETNVNGTPVSLTLWTRASDFTNCAMTIQVWEQVSGDADATGAVTITPTGNDTWEEFTYTITSTYASDEELWIKIAITSLDTSDTIDFGRIKVNY